MEGVDEADARDDSVEYGIESEYKEPEVAGKSPYLVRRCGFLFLEEELYHSHDQQKWEKEKDKFEEQFD